MTKDTLGHINFPEAAVLNVKDCDNKRWTFKQTAVMTTLLFQTISRGSELLWKRH